MAFKASQSRSPACSHPTAPLMQPCKAPTLEHPIRLKLTAKPQPGRMGPLPPSQPLPWPQDLASPKTSFQRKEQDLPQSSMCSPLSFLRGTPKP